MMPSHRCFVFILSIAPEKVVRSVQRVDEIMCGVDIGANKIDVFRFCG